MKHILILFILGLSINAFSQISYPYTSAIPEGYQIKDVNKEDGAKISGDFDNDGKKDLAIIYYKKDFNGAILVIYLSSLYGTNQTYQWCDWFHMINDFSYESNLLKLSSIDMGKYITEINLKYDPITKNMKILKYNEDGVDIHPKFELKSSK